MADNVTSDPGAGGVSWQTAELSWSGSTVHSAGGFQGLLSGSPGAWTYTALVGGAGAVGAGVQRMTLASDDPAVASLASILSALQGTLTVGSHAVTNAGAFVVQENGAALTALQLIDDAIATLGSGVPGKAQAVAGTDGANARMLHTDAAGDLQVDVLTSALPSGAATEAKQDTVIGHVDGIESSLGDAVASLDVMDDWDESNRCKANLIVSQAGVAGGAGAVGANTLRVVLATDDPAVALLTQIDVDTGSIATSVATTATNTGASATSLAIIDDWDEGDRCKVNPISGQAGVAAGAGSVGATTQRMTLASDDPAVVSLQIIDNCISGNEAQVDVVGALPAGTNTIGNVGTVPLTSGGLTPYRNIDVDESEDQVKGSAGQVYWIHAMNLASGVRYLHFYDDTPANVTVGTTTPTLTIPIPTQGDTNGAGFTVAIDKGLAFANAITVAATTTLTGNDAPGANEVVLSLGYK